MNKEKLKPCPFCGEEAEYNYEPIGRDNHFMGESFIYCKECGVGCNRFKLSEKELMKAWNTRAEDKVKDDMLNELKNINKWLEDCDNDYEVVTKTGFVYRPIGIIKEILIYQIKKEEEYKKWAESNWNEEITP